MKHLPNQDRAAGGFTLIEMLTVISIVAVLASLAWVGFGAALKKAHGAKCTSNLRTLQVAMSTYSIDWKHWPTLNRETPTNPSVPGTSPWYYSLITQGYVNTHKENRDGYECLIAEAFTCPSNEDNPGARYPWTSAPYPWIPNYAINSYWGTYNGIEWVNTLGGISTLNAILLVDSTSGPSLYPSSNATWDKPGCMVPRDLHGTGAHAVLANGAVIIISPETHPNLKDPKYWDPRYAGN
ncbi:MAG: type II secretion system protein [Verrucomicrobiota bacterium]